MEVSELRELPFLLFHNLKIPIIPSDEQSKET